MKRKDNNPHVSCHKYYIGVNRVNKKGKREAGRVKKIKRKIFLTLPEDAT